MIAAGLAAGAGERVRGLIAGGLVVGSGDSIEGVALGGGMIKAPDLRGLAVTPGYLRAYAVEGFGVCGVCRTDEQTGVTIGLVNLTQQLRGAQIGLVNYAANNPRGLKLLPLVNLNLR